MNNMIMGGKITWLSVIGLVLMGANDIYMGEYQGGGEKIIAAIGVLGLGRKIEKTK